MSSLAPAPGAPGSRARTAGHPARFGTRVTGDWLLGLALAAALCVLAFTTGGGQQLQPDTANTVSQIVLVLLGAGLGVAVMVRGRRGRGGGGAAVLAFTALVTLTYASIAWSVQPAYSWLEANLTLSYLAAFAGAMALARLGRERWPALVVAVAVWSLVVCVYALLTKVFPSHVAAAEYLGRLQTPFGYWNATGLAAALGLPCWLWLGAAARSRRALSALAVPAVGALVCALALSYGRGAVVAAVIGLAVWFALVPARLRGALVLALGAAGGAAVSAWASGQVGLTHDHAPVAARVADGHRFAVVLVIALVVLLGIGAAVALAQRRVSVPAVARRRIGLVLIGLLALVPVGGVIALAASSRGFGGEVSHLWSELTSPRSTVSDNPGRLSQLGSSRPAYWRDGLRVGGHAPLAGTGAFGFWIAHKRYAPDKVLEAHSYVVQTFADLGAIGLAVSAALLIAWALAVRRSLAGLVARPRAPDGARAGLATLLAVAVIFGVHSAIDWTWFIPGVAVPALLCAGWLAGYGAPASERPGPAPARSTLDPLRVGAAVVMGAAALMAAWIVWQPLRSSNADAAALSAAQNGDAGAAITDARTAASADPVDYVPLATLGGIYTGLADSSHGAVRAQYLAQARAEYARATTRQPENPDAWYALYQFDAAHGHPAAAGRELARAKQLDPLVLSGQ